MASGHEIMGRRRALDMTQAHLAKAACVSRSTIQRAERGLPVSSESLRSIRAVLGMNPPAPQAYLAPAPAAVPAPPGSIVTGRMRRLDLALLIPSLILAAALNFYPPHISDPIITDPIKAVLPGHDIGRIRFELVMLLTSLTLLPALLAGRMAWRRIFHPECDRAIVGFGRPLAGMSWTRGSIELGRIPWPFVRWTEGGRAVRTWPGAVLAASLMLPMAFAIHLDPPLERFAAAFGYDDVTDIVPTWYVEPGSPLERAGLRIGDVVTAMEGAPVREWRDVRSRIMDAYGRLSSIPVEVLRKSPPGTDFSLRKVETLTLDVPLVDNPRRPQCVGLPNCGWIGDVTGLVSSLPRNRPMSEALLSYASEIAFVARMTIDPVLQDKAVYRNGPGTFMDWTRWSRFEEAFMGAAWALALLSAALVAVSDIPGAGLSLVGPVMRRVQSVKARITGAMARVRFPPFGLWMGPMVPAA